MDTNLYFKFALTLILVVGLIFLTGALLKRFGGTGIVMPRRGQPRRLRVVETVAVDPKRRLVLVRRDDHEHLLLVGGGSDLVVESGLEARPESASDTTAALSDTPFRRGGPRT